MKTGKKTAAIVLALTFLMAMIPVAVIGGRAAVYTDLQVEDFTGYWGDPSQADDGVKIVTDATFNTALDADYVTFTMQIGSLLTGNNAQMSFGFMSALKDIDATSANRLRFYLRNDQYNPGKLNIDAYNVTQAEARLIEFHTFTDIGVTDELTVVFAKNAAAGWSLTVNGTTLADTHGNFAQIAESDFCGADGKTYLGFASYTDTPDGYTRDTALNYTVKSISDEAPPPPPPEWAADWQHYYWDIEKDGDGVKIVCDATYKKPLSPDYIEFTVNIGALRDSDKGWVMFGFQSDVADINNSDPGAGAVSPKRVRFYLRNDGGKLNIFGENMTQNANLANFLRFDNINAVGNDITVVFAKGENGAWSISFGGVKMLDASGNMAKITASDFCGADGKTYLGFASWTDVPEGAERQDTLYYTVKSIKNEKPGHGGETSNFLPGAQVSDYTTPWGGERGEDFARFHADVLYNTPLDPGYIKAVFEIEKLTPIAYDSQFNAVIIICLGNKAEMPNPDDPSKLEQLPGIAILLRNLNGKLLIDINGYGVGVRGGATAWTFLRKATAIPTLGQKHMLEIRRVGTRYDIYLNGAKLSDDDSVIMPDSHMLSGGKTYLSFLGRDDTTVDSTLARVWKMYEISNTGDPGYPDYPGGTDYPDDRYDTDDAGDRGNPDTGVPGAALAVSAVLLSTAMLGVLLLPRRRKSANR